MTALGFLSFTRSVKVFNKSYTTQILFNLKIKPFFKILWKILGISRKVPLTSIPSSRDWYVLFVVYKICYIHELPCLKSGWLDKIIINEKLKEIIIYYTFKCCAASTFFQLSESSPILMQNLESISERFVLTHHKFWSHRYISYHNCFTLSL